MFGTIILNPSKILTCTVVVDVVVSWRRAGSADSAVVVEQVETEETGREDGI